MNNESKRNIFTLGNSVEKVICKLVTMLCRPQGLNMDLDHGGLYLPEYDNMVKHYVLN